MMGIMTSPDLMHYTQYRHFPILAHLRLCLPGRMYRSPPQYMEAQEENPRKQFLFLEKRFWLLCYPFG